MGELREIKAVTFDVGGTLIHPWPSVGHVYADVVAEAGFGPLEAESIARGFRSAWQARIAFDYSLASWLSVAIESFDGLLDREAVTALFPMLYGRFAHAKVWRLFPDALPTLAQCRAAGCKLGIISNWDERLCPVLEDLGLEPLFDVILISAEVGTTKPHANIFRQAANRLGVAPSSILHVGDSECEDVVGATESGLHSVLLDRSGGDDAPRPGVITHLGALPALLN